MTTTNNQEKKIITFPEKVGEFPAYLEITLSTLSGGDFIGKIKEEFTNITKSTLSFIGNATSVFGELAISTLLGKSNTVVQDQITQMFDNRDTNQIDYFRGKEKLTFITYIPSEFESQIVSNWSEGELFGGIGTVLNNLDKLPVVGSLLSQAYSTFKNNVSIATSTAITPKMLKVYQPDFFNFDLNFEYVMDNKEESEKFLRVMRIFQESQRPSQFLNSEELYSFPAIFDVKIVINKETITADGKKIVSTKSSDDSLNLWNYITSQKGYGLTNITVSPKSGNSVDMKFRNDGTNAIYNVKMSFVSLRRMFSNKTVSKRVDDLVKGL